MHSITLSEITGADIWLKFENLQFTAAYKERGALNALLQLTDEQRARGVIAASAGNHSQGLSYHGTRLAVPVTIVMPRTTPTVKVMQTESVGGNVVLWGETFDDAYAHARELEAERGLTFVHPFDDPRVAAGAGTVALEMLEDKPDLECLVTPIGGGGLISGMATVARALDPAYRDRGRAGGAFSQHVLRVQERSEGNAAATLWRKGSRSNSRAPSPARSSPSAWTTSCWSTNPRWKRRCRCCSRSRRRWSRGRAPPGWRRC